MTMHPAIPPELDPQTDLVDRFRHVARIWEIIDQLRGEPGCPWDRKQTPQSVQTYLVEEAHEAAAAIVSVTLPRSETNWAISSLWCSL